MAFKMVKTTMTLLAIALPLLPMSTAFAQEAHGNQAFGFRAPSISGHINAGGGAVSLSGGGAYDPATGFIHAGGSFRCIADFPAAGTELPPLAGCKAGQGGTWIATALLPSRNFRCRGGGKTGPEPVDKTVNSDDKTVVMTVDFYLLRGRNEPVAVEGSMFVSQIDEATDAANPGIQNVWINRIGCGEAIANFN